MEPFTYRYYRGMLEAALAGGYRISSFARYDASAPKTVILRHDADYTLDGLLRFAEIERELGATATYFFRVHADYNPFAPTTVATIRKLEAMGHEIGLHFEAMNVGRALKLDPPELLRREKLVLETVLGHAVASCSEHRELSGVVHRTPVYDTSHDPKAAGFSVYAMDAKWTKEMKYLSDSNANWREGDLHEHLGKHDRFQILVHADWWFEDDLLLKGPYVHGTQG